MLTLAREAGERGGSAPCVYNAANEVAVAAFLDGQLGFCDIARTVATVLGDDPWAGVASLAELEAVDHAARQRARQAIVHA